MNYSAYHTLTINGQRMQGLEIVRFCKNSDQENIRQIGAFMSNWLSDTTVLEVHTSGSTGRPKTISVEKNQMLRSAAMTAEFFGFKPGQTALLCLPLSYIAGKMMVVRALFSGLNLYCIEPATTPIDSLPADEPIDFAPLVPAQLTGVSNTKSIKKILLGGAQVPMALEESLQSVKAEIFHGYGMTETLSHVAIRHVNGMARSDVYRALKGISFDVDDNDCLEIDVPFLHNTVYTNDVVHLISEHEFAWRGRFDSVINSGGIKLFPEEIERKLSGIISGRFFFAGLPDERFGERLTLFIEGEEYSNLRYEALLREFSYHLDKFEKPKQIFFVKEFRTTPSGKIKRGETVRAVLNS